jgi:hypothetical protein
MATGSTHHWTNTRCSESPPDARPPPVELALAPIAGDTVNDAVRRFVRLIGLDPAVGGRGAWVENEPSVASRPR